MALILAGIVIAVMAGLARRGDDRAPAPAP
jgi:hypothetical protein